MIRYMNFTEEVLPSLLAHRSLYGCVTKHRRVDAKTLRLFPPLNFAVYTPSKDMVAETKKGKSVTVTTSPLF